MSLRVPSGRRRLQEATAPSQETVSHIIPCKTEKSVYSRVNKQSEWLSFRGFRSLSSRSLSSPVLSSALAAGFLSSRQLWERYQSPLLSLGNGIHKMFTKRCLQSKTPNLKPMLHANSKQVSMQRVHTGKLETWNRAAGKSKSSNVQSFMVTWSSHLEWKLLKKALRVIRKA